MRIRSCLILIIALVAGAYAYQSWDVPAIMSAAGGNYSSMSQINSHRGNNEDLLNLVYRNIPARRSGAAISVTFNRVSVTRQVPVGSSQAYIGTLVLQATNEESHLLRSIRLYCVSPSIMENLDLTLSPSIRISSTPTSVNVTLDLSSLLISGITTRIGICSVTTQRVSSDKVILTPVNALGPPITFVAADTPIIKQFQVPAYIGSNRLISVNLVYDVSTRNRTGDMNLASEGSDELTCYYRLYDFDLGRLVFEGAELNPQKFNGIDLSKLLGTQALSEESPWQGLIHKHHYQIAVQIRGRQSSEIISSDVFQVDLTPPNQPEILTKDGQLLVSLSDLDPESGLQAVHWETKSTKAPYWQTALTENISPTRSASVPWSPEESADTRYFYRASVQNKAGNWSACSTVIQRDARSLVALSEGLFNAPNPFDSRRESTTIYYTLNDTARVELVIYSVFGYVVNRWSFPSQSSGSQIITWDGTNTAGEKVGRGVYYVVLRASTSTGQEKVLKTKIAVIH